jgi:hypothetical protein
MNHQQGSFSPLLPQIPVITPLAPHERQFHHKLFGTDRADHAGHRNVAMLASSGMMNDQRTFQTN